MKANLLPLALIILSVVACEKPASHPTADAERAIQEEMRKTLNELTADLNKAKAAMEEAKREQIESQKLQDSLFKSMEAIRKLTESYTEYRSQVHKELSKQAANYLMSSARADLVSGEAREIYLQARERSLKNASEIIAATADHGAFEAGEAQAFFEEMARMPQSAKNP